MTRPRWRLLLAALVALPGAAFADPGEPLTQADEDRYRQIFAAQEDGEWQTADGLIGQLEDKVLLGYVLEQRYMHPTAYRASYPELSRWLAAYADHPDAARIYRLARIRQQGARAPRQPMRRPWRNDIQEVMHPELAADYADPSRAATVRRIENRLRTLTRKGRPAEALNYLNDPRQFNQLTAAQTDRVRGWIAASFYYEGELTRARQLAETAARRSHEHAVLSHWVAGLVAWRQDDRQRAYEHFAAQADIPYQEDTLRAAGAFWAARAALSTGNAGAVRAHLETAAQFPLTFYGQLALGQLGRDPGVSWDLPALTQADYDALVAAAPRVERAAALAQVGQDDDAEEEFKWAQAELTGDHDLALLALARTADLPAAQLHIAKQAHAERTDKVALRPGLFPVPTYAPNGGFTVDPALIFALIRQESKFQPTATSGVGARGLMQLMPRTAAYVSGDGALASGRASGKLYDPGYNMSLGQSYVEELLTRYNDGSGDLFEMALSYNWGPGNYRRWRAQTEIEDPLLMIESVPNSEARHFVETVLTNLWVYRHRMGEPAPSRDETAAGGAPRYRSVK